MIKRLNRQYGIQWQPYKNLFVYNGLDKKKVLFTILLYHMIKQMKCEVYWVAIITG